MKIKITDKDFVYPPRSVEEVAERDEIIKLLSYLDAHMIELRKAQRKADGKKDFYKLNHAINKGYNLKNLVIDKLERYNLVRPKTLIKQKHNGKTFFLTSLESENPKYTFVIPSRAKDFLMFSKDEAEILEGVVKEKETEDHGLSYAFIFRKLTSFVNYLEKDKIDTISVKQKSFNELNSKGE